MPQILVLKSPASPEERVQDEITVTEDNLGNKVEELYEKLNPDYSIEIRYD